MRSYFCPAVIHRKPVAQSSEGALRARRFSETTVIVPPAFVTLDSAGTAHGLPAGVPLAMESADFAIHIDVEPTVARAHDPYVPVTVTFADFATLLEPAAQSVLGALRAVVAAVTVATEDAGTMSAAFGAVHASTRAAAPDPQRFTSGANHCT